MSFTADNIAELDVLLHYDPSVNQEGIKIHKEAAPALRAAAKRLFEKGFITQVDGGYLTSLGNEAAEQAQSLYTMLNAD